MEQWVIVTKSQNYNSIIHITGSKSRSPKGDQSLLRRLFGLNWSPLGLFLLRKSPIDQNIRENVGFFKQFGTHIRI